MDSQVRPINQPLPDHGERAVVGSARGFSLASGAGSSHVEQLQSSAGSPPV